MRDYVTQTGLFVSQRQHAGNQIGPGTPRQSPPARNAPGR